MSAPRLTKHQTAALRYLLDCGGIPEYFGEYEWPCFGWANPSTIGSLVRRGLTRWGEQRYELTADGIRAARGEWEE